MQENTPAKNDRRYTIPELASATGMSTAFWRRVVFDGRIEVERYGRAARVSHDALERYRTQAKPRGEAA